MITTLEKTGFMQFDGFRADIHSLALTRNFSPDGKNVEFVDGAVQKCPGYAKLSATQMGGTGVGVTVFKMYDGARHLVALTTTKLYTFNSATDVMDDITGGTLTGTSDGLLSAAIWLDDLYTTNNADQVKVWSGTGNVANLTNSPVDTCKCLGILEGHLLLFNTTESGTVYPVRMRGSDLRDPTAWTPGAGSESVSTDLDDDPYEILAYANTRGFGIVFKSDVIWKLEYVTAPLYYRAEPLVNRLGIMAGATAATFDDRTFFWGSDGSVYRIDETGYEDVGAAVADYLLERRNVEYQNRSFGWIDPDHRTYNLMIPTGTSTTPDERLRYHYDTKKWDLPRELDFTGATRYRYLDALTWAELTGTWASLTGSWERLGVLGEGEKQVVVDTDGYVYELGATHAEDGSAFTGEYQTKLDPLTDDLKLFDLIKEVQRVEIIYGESGSHNLDVSVGWSDTANGTITWSDEQTLPLDGTTEPFVDFRESGRYFAVRLRTDGANEPFELRGIIVYWRFRGER